MKIKIDCPLVLENMDGQKIQIKRYTSNVSNGTYLACLYDDKVIGMCDEISGTEKMTEDDYLEGEVISSEVIYMMTSTILYIKLL